MPSSQGEAALQSLLQRTDRRHAPRHLMANKGSSGNGVLAFALIIGFAVGFGAVAYSTGTLPGMLGAAKTPLHTWEHQPGKAVEGHHHDEKGKWLDERADHHDAVPAGGQGGRRYGSSRQGGGGAAGGEAHVATEVPTPDESQGAKGKVHVIVTSNGNRYMNWQTRLVYRSFQMVVAEDPSGPLHKFTRVLHRCSDDELTEAVPTFRVDSSRPDCDVWCDYPVADRAPALKSWAQSPDARQCEFVLVAETDYLFMRQMAPISIARGQAMSFSFGYIIPTYPTIKDVMNRLYRGYGGSNDKDLSKIPGTGNAPVLIHREDFLTVADHWIPVVNRIEADDEARDKLGWVREMYAYSIAAAEVGIHHDTRLPPESVLMVQPPADVGLGKACMCHYTWGTILTMGVPGEPGANEVWRWDKREYMDGQFGPSAYKFAPIPPMPPWQEVMHTQDKRPFKKGQWELLNMMINRINDIIAVLNNENNGYPQGIASDAEMIRRSQPSQKAWEARRAKEAEENRKRALEKTVG